MEFRAKVSNLPIGNPVVDQIKEAGRGTFPKY